MNQKKTIPIYDAEFSHYSCTDLSDFRHQTNLQHAASLSKRHWIHPPLYAMIFSGVVVFKTVSLRTAKVAVVAAVHFWPPCIVFPRPASAVLSRTAVGQWRSLGTATVHKSQTPPPALPAVTSSAHTSLWLILPHRLIPAVGREMCSGQITVMLCGWMAHYIRG